MALEINKIYLIHTGFFENWDREYYENLIPLVHTHTTNRMDEEIMYYFEDPLSDYTDNTPIYNDAVPELSLSDCVFETEARFFQYTLKESKRLEKPIGPFLQNLIDKSIENNPEEWI